MVTEVKEEHRAKAAPPIVVTLSGIVIDVKEEHPENALSSIVVIPLEMMTVTNLLLISFGLIFISPAPVNVNDVKEEQYSNALSPIDVTLFGIMMEVKEGQS